MSERISDERLAGLLLEAKAVRSPYGSVDVRVARFMEVFTPKVTFALLADLTEFRDRETRIRDVLSGVPECDTYKPGDGISCGWKRDLLAIRNIVEGADGE